MKREVLYRPHRGGLAEAMAEVRTVASREELISIIREELSHYSVEVKEENFHVKQYGYDERINWDTYIVTLDGFGVLGFTNGPLGES